MRSGFPVIVLLISFYLAGTASGRNDAVTGHITYISGEAGSTGADIAGQSYSFSVYPNPTMDNVRLRIIEGDPVTLKYQLYDITGKMKQENRLEEAETIIQMEHLAPSLYFLKIKKDNFTVTLLKIIKY